MKSLITIIILLIVPVGFLIVPRLSHAAAPGTITLEVTDPCAGTPNCDPVNVETGIDTATFVYAVTANNDEADHTFELYYGVSTGAGTDDADSGVAGIKIPSVTCASGADPIVLTGAPTIDNTSNGCGDATWNAGSLLVDWDTGSTTCTAGSDQITVTWDIEFCSEAGGNTYDIDTTCTKSGGVANCGTSEYLDEWGVNGSASTRRIFIID